MKKGASVKDALAGSDTATKRTHTKSERHTKGKLAMSINDERAQKADHDNDDHSDDIRGLRGCAIHNPDSHWQDDIAYVDPKRLPVPEDAPRWADMVNIIKDAEHTSEGKAIFRFALTFINEDGDIEVLTSGEESIFSAINMLTRAASLMAFQQGEKERDTKLLMAHALRHALDKMPFLSEDESEPEIPGKPIGGYL